MSKFYITTSIPYVNGDPHLGHGMEFTMGDVLARYARQQGHDVIFSTGTDEHGGKIADKAEELNKTPQAFVDEMSQKFIALQKDLNISVDKFIRTTDKEHEKRSQAIWKLLAKDIYKGSYVGLYCTGCEEFVSQAVAKANNNICPHHNKLYEKLEEENYFFALSRYTEQIKKSILDNSFKIVPSSKKNEILSVLKDGLEDISISRPKDKLAWGIAVPGDSNQVMYVWFEAVLNYITVLGFPENDEFKKFWPADVQIIGKDILRFHAAIFPGILLALGLPLAIMLYVHGFINIDSKKMSKSLGNYVAPEEVISKYSADVFRYFFLRHIPSYEDGDFTWQRLDDAYNNELADQLGNAVSRTVAMVQKYQTGLVGDIPDVGHDLGPYQQSIADCRFDRALDEIFERVKGVNQYIDEEKPWVIAKEDDPDHLREVLALTTASLLEIASMLTPFMPETADKIRKTFGDGFVRPLESSLFPKTDTKDESPKK